jgi:hypothetical protein
MIKAGQKGGASRHRAAATATVRPAVSPATRTFEAFTQKEKRNRTGSSVPKRVQPVHNDRRHNRWLITVLGGIALGLVAALIFAASAPQKPWVFDRPEAQRPSLQARHTLY